MIIPSFLPGFFRFLYRGSKRNGSARWFRCLRFLFHASWISSSCLIVLLGIFCFRSLSFLYCSCIFFFFLFFVSLSSAVFVIVF